MPLEDEGVNRMVMHVLHIPEGKIANDQRQLIQVSVWPADKPTLVEKLAMQAFLASVKKLRLASKPYESH